MNIKNKLPWKNAVKMKLSICSTVTITTVLHCSLCYSVVTHKKAVFDITISNGLIRFQLITVHLEHLFTKPSC